EIFARWRKDVNNLGVLKENSLVLDIAGYHRDVTGNHRPALSPDTKIHLAFEHPDNLLVRMLMCRRMCARLHFPPDDHFMASREHRPLNLFGETLKRQFCKRAEPRDNWHTFPPLWPERTISPCLRRISQIRRFKGTPRKFVSIVVIVSQRRARQLGAGDSAAAARKRSIGHQAKSQRRGAAHFNHVTASFPVGDLPAPPTGFRPHSGDPPGIARAASDPERC